MVVLQGIRRERENIKLPQKHYRCEKDRIWGHTKEMYFFKQELSLAGSKSECKYIPPPAHVQPRCRDSRAHD